MNWMVVAVVQLVVAWFVVGYAPKPGVTIGNYYLVYAVMAGIVVWLVGLALSFAAKESARPTILNLGASVAIALLVAVFIQFGRDLGLDGVLSYLPLYGGRQGLILLCSVAGYWAADDVKKLPFNPIFLPGLVVGIFGAVFGVFAGGALLHTVVPPGTYPRILLAIPILAGGAVGFCAGVALAVGVAFPFRRER